MPSCTPERDVAREGLAQVTQGQELGKQGTSLRGEEQQPPPKAGLWSAWWLQAGTVVLSQSARDWQETWV